jgi:hypothetical protein
VSSLSKRIYLEIMKQPPALSYSAPRCARNKTSQN